MNDIMVHENFAMEPTDSLSVEEVLWVHHWNDGLFSFAVTRPPSFRFRSGEFVMIGLPASGKPLLRAYSIACASYAEEVEFLSIKVPDGPLTSRLCHIQPGDKIYLGRKPTGTLVLDALRPGRRLFLLATGTGLAPFLSLIRDPDVYSAYSEVVVAHSVRRVADLAYREELESHLAADPLVADEALVQLHYVPTVTREPFYNNRRLDKLIADGTLFRDVTGPAHFDPADDRVMLCGSMEMNRQFAEMLERSGFVEGANNKPGDFVLERAFVG
ncbi:ferredoxin--NADP reductase [Aurantiacibacter flavus]|uniref:ferredoxin--NADP(+) reductase n=1 Tax=Aurantiacibacter flavus TaxID=3145232 RepID=A0ABV0CY92_9SPHN